MKNCIRCREMKPIEEFYRHPMMFDGHLNKCKACCRTDAVKNRRKKLEYYRQYDRERFVTLRRRESVHASLKKQNAAHPEKRAARIAVGNAIRRGTLIRKPCEVCGTMQSEAHHEDYSKPLDVRWFCRVHHLMHHGNYIVQGSA